MNIYSLIRLYRRINSPRLKLLGILTLHLLRRRYLNMVIDPVLGCNLRCRMCYFSDPEARKNLHGTFTGDDINAIAKSLFHRVLRLQIGCGAEPTIYKRLDELVRTAADSGIKNISLTTNGQLLTKELAERMAEYGLSEVTLSAHGMTEKVYETMMQNARFTQFLQTIANLGEVRKGHPGLKIRVNYTINEDNIADLKLMPQVFADTKPDIIQLRPIQRIGNSDYSNFSMEKIAERYDECILPVIRFCEANGIVCIYPERSNLDTIQSEDTEGDSHTNSAVEMLPYFQLGPHEGWKEKIDPYKETFEDYCRRTHRVRQMFRLLFGLAKDEDTEGPTKALNYQIK